MGRDVWDYSQFPLVVGDYGLAVLELKQRLNDRIASGVIQADFLDENNLVYDQKTADLVQNYTGSSNIGVSTYRNL